MKKLMIYAVMASLFCVAMPMQMSAATNANPSSTIPSASQSLEAKALQTRLDEIKQIDKSTLTPAAKKQLRKETRSIKKQLKELGGGVYLSAGAIVLIVVLLIILL